MFCLAIFFLGGGGVSHCKKYWLMFLSVLLATPRARGKWVGTRVFTCTAAVSVHCVSCSINGGSTISSNNSQIILSCRLYYTYSIQYLPHRSRVWHVFYRKETRGQTQDMLEILYVSAYILWMDGWIDSPLRHWASLIWYFIAAQTYHLCYPVCLFF